MPAARSQSSAMDSGRKLSATRAPATVGVTQPELSQETPSASEESAAVRASASAASHSLTTKASLPPRIRCSRPSLPRTATLRPSPAIRMSGRGAPTAQTRASSSTPAPLQRSGVRNRPIRMMPRLATISGIGLYEKCLDGERDHAQPEGNGHPNRSSAEAEGKGRQDQPHTHQQAGNVLPVLNAHESALASEPRQDDTACA